MQGAYHGRTIGSLSLTRSKSIYGEGASPVMVRAVPRSSSLLTSFRISPEHFVTAFPYWHQLGVPPDTPEAALVSLALHQLDLLFAQQTGPTETAAIIIEPVLGEGGYVPAPTSFLSALRAICDKHGIVLIFDEVQSGFGRCGKYFACEWSGVRPDIMVFAKGMANGFPLSGVVSSKDRMDMMPPGTMGGTYAGNAVSCAAAIACAGVMEVSQAIDHTNLHH
jgi:4-aminobutyrate aminotransferase